MIKVVVSARKAGKVSHMKKVVEENLRAGVHFHTFGPDGEKCYNGECVIRSEARCDQKTDG